MWNCVKLRDKWTIDLLINGGQFIILLSKCKLAYQVSIPYSELKRILALK